MAEKKAKIKDLCKQKYRAVLEEGDESSIAFWELMSSVANNSYNEGYEDGQQKRENTKNLKIIYMVIGSG